jgi:hypothetical protein
LRRKRKEVKMEWIRSEQVRGKKWSRCVVGEKKMEMGEGVVGHVCGGKKGDQKIEKKKKKKIGGGNNPLQYM